MTPESFFASMRAWHGHLDHLQVDGMNTLLDAVKDMPLSWKAYVMATAWHETDTIMQPIHEYGSRSYFNKYEPDTSIGKRLGNAVRGDGYKFRGRGYVQLTGRSNYAKAGKVFGEDFLEAPDMVLLPQFAARIAVEGMEEGWFTGKTLADYLTSEKTEYINARRIINGLDKATIIAGYARHFEAALA